MEIHRVKFSPVPRTVYNNIDATLDVIGDPEIKEINFYGRVEGARAKDHEAAMSVLSAALGAFCSAVWRIKAALSVSIPHKRLIVNLKKRQSV